MSSLLEKRTHLVAGDSSAIEFEHEGGGAWPVWDRFLKVRGKRAYHMGNVCDTCSFFFQRLEGATERVSPESEALAERLRSGVATLDGSLLGASDLLLPSGEYDVLLLELTPRLVFPGQDDDYFVNEEPALWGVDAFWALPHNPRVPYYRLDLQSLGGGAALFEFIVPMYPQTWLDENTVGRYTDRILSGERPTALAVAALDVKRPAVWEGQPDVTAHWCLPHYLIDGHHKLYAAAQCGASVTLLSFVSKEQGVSTPEEHEQLMDCFRKTM
jgi:hypothetical protein